MARPLGRAHGGGAGVGEEVECHPLGGEGEEVVVRLLKPAFALDRWVSAIGSTTLILNGSKMTDIYGLPRDYQVRTLTGPGDHRQGYKGTVAIGP